MQLSRLQSLKNISLRKSIQLDNINNWLYHEFQIEDNQLQILEENTLLLFTTTIEQKR